MPSVAGRKTLVSLGHGLVNERNPRHNRWLKKCYHAKQNPRARRGLDLSFSRLVEGFVRAGFVCLILEIAEFRLLI
jgi:hypothetical protein